MTAVASRLRAIERSLPPALADGRDRLAILSALRALGVPKREHGDAAASYLTFISEGRRRRGLTVDSDDPDWRRWGLST